MDSILHNSKCWFTADGRLEVYDHKLATKLNKHFQRYENGDYRFKEGEEAVFMVPQLELNNVLRRFLTSGRAQNSTPPLP
jgi:hypothetical protein